MKQLKIICWKLFSFKPLLFDLPYFSEKMNLFHLVFGIPELGFPGSSDGKVSAYDAGDLGSIPGSGRSPGEGNGNPLQYSCLENPTDREPGMLQPTGSQRVGPD